jgi:transposase
MPMVAQDVDAVVGGDTHRDTHRLAMVFPTGVPIAELSVRNDEAGFATAIGWIGEHAPGRQVKVFLEGTRSYGVGLARALAAAGYPVFEVEPIRRGERRTGKSDAIDAHLIALHGLRMDSTRLPEPRADGDREALRILLGARDELNATRTEQINRLRHLLLSGDDADRRLARGAVGKAVLRSIAVRADLPGQGRDHQIRIGELRRLASAIISATDQLAANEKQLAEIVAEVVPGVLDRFGVGPVAAAQALVCFSHSGRFRNDAAFASLAGVSPVEASSGQRVRHRLNRAGDRALNKAIHAIMFTRWRSCVLTRAYITRRLAEGKTNAEIRRCLKRYIARELYRALNKALTPRTDQPNQSAATAA